MANLTVRNIPDDVYERLKQRAAANRRSLNQEIVLLLERVDQPTAEEKQDFLTRLRAFHQTLPDFEMTDAEISAAKRKGRP